MIIKEQLIKDTPYKYGTSNGRKYIVIHETGNTNKGADAQAHANLQSKGNSRNASWHYTVDDKGVFKHFDHKFQLWHAGDGRADGNLHGIGVEICVNSDGNYRKAVENARELVKRIMKEEGIPHDRVKQHHAFSGKNCPTYLRNGSRGITWSDFITGLNDKKPSIPVKKPTKPTEIPVKSDTNSIVDYLTSREIDPSFSHRAQLAKEFGIKNYKGTAKQNIELLNLLRDEGVEKKAKTEWKALNETSIVDFLKANGISSSMTNRKKLAVKHGVKGYKGTAEQNVLLLAKIKQS